MYEIQPTMTLEKLVLHHSSHSVSSGDNHYDLETNAAGPNTMDRLSSSLTGYTPGKSMSQDFSTVSLIGVAFGLTSSWLGISSSLVTGISSGGPMMIIYGIIIVASLSLCVGISLSELASSMPNAGGQVFWARKLAPPQHAPLASYITGFFAFAGYIFSTVSVTITVASILVAMYIFNCDDPTKSAEKWQIFVTFELLNVIILPLNLWEKPLIGISSTFLWISLVSFVVSVISVLATSSPNYQLAQFVFVDFENATGWKSSGIAFLVGLINPAWSFGGMDGATHLAEESRNPRTDIPKAIIGTVIIGFTTALIYSISMFFCIGDLDSILSTNTGLPIIEIYHQALNSKAGATVLTFLIFLTALCCNIAVHTCQSRICWSISRDNALPGSKYWSQVHPKTGVPVKAHIFCCSLCAIVGCMYMASSTAYNSMMVGTITFLLLSYCVPVVCLLWRGRDTIEKGPFWLGKVGLVANWVLIAWTIFTIVFFSFPQTMPVTKDNMNYISVIIVGLGIYAWLYWVLRGKKTFKFSDAIDIAEM